MISHEVSGTAVVVVHYKSMETLAATLADLSQVFDREKIFVVDNSDDLESSWDLLATIIRPRDNLGYARAVNEGVRNAIARQPHLADVLICTHETRFATGVVQRLLDVSAQFPHGHVVAPRLMTKDGRTGKLSVWSEGGTLSRLFRYPKHIRTGRVHGVRNALWVDGAAFVLSIRSWTKLGGIPEDFFLYMEDVALGIACKRSGIPVLVALDVEVEQSANGPSRYLAIRNRLILARRYFSWFGRSVVYAEIYGRAILLGAARRSKASESWRAIHDARVALK
jgi:N-acetylglucosaminyl-diphospho-decaprenol L-rhamnosyltransferase